MRLARYSPILRPDADRDGARSGDCVDVRAEQAMHMGDSADDADTMPIRPGRYLLPLSRRLYLAALVAAELLFGYLNWRPGDMSGVLGWQVVAIVAVVLVAALASWFVAVTVVGQRGIHRPMGRYRRIPWSDVAGFLVVRTWRFARVEVQLRNGRNVTLVGVPENALRVAPIGPSSLDLFRPTPLTPSRGSAATDDPWRPPSK
jgi:hypothetical protein